ncbi:hypothetical protein DAPPUDRAFT_308017 [Daphnia pulex]|uniref:Uncharacterized protein n=1 Tax=Daphnia pulex TaxID=6669 RepID=E9H5D3_DAPPU|nr:hypothetical protein DAPPUDRAFT_308017 [Daphnia pulex]|eukprot:EFX72939.1 hypothetical protein DAPPUDRAFT_308017 [Daphnia pulex]
MKLALIFLVSALVVVSQQQFLRARPRGLVWWSPMDNYHQLSNPYDDYQPEEIPVSRSSYAFRRQQFRPSRPVVYVPQNEEVNGQADFVPAADENEHVEYPDTQSRISSFKAFKNGGRFFYSSTVNNPFFKTATFTLTSTVTTLASIVLCVPSNNLVAVPSPTCAGRKKREIEDSEDNQFPIAPSETLKLVPTSLPSLDGVREARQAPSVQQQSLDHLISSKDVGVVSPVASLAEKDQQANRDKRFFGGGIVASTTVTSYSFIGATVTSTVILDPTGKNVAPCLPAGYVVCA